MSFRRISHLELDGRRLRQLLQDGAVEGPELEFKAELANERAAQFLKEITAFANTRGGDLLVGVTDDGSPIGVASSSLRAQIDRIQSALDSGVDPPLHGVQYFPIDLGEGLSVLMVRVPKSQFGPHMITSDGMLRFYKRSEAASTPMRTEDLRVQFTYGANAVASIESWRQSRLPIHGARVLNPQVFVHIFPLTSLDGTTHVDIAELANGNDGLAVLRSPPTTTRIFLEGIARGNSKDWNHSSTLLSRSGWLESQCQLDVIEDARSKHIRIDRAWFRELIEVLHRNLVLLKRMSFAPPIAIGIAFVDIRGSYLLNGSSVLGTADNCDHAVLPMLMLERWPDDLTRTVWPVFDHLVGAFGLANVPESLRFNTAYKLSD